MKCGTCETDEHQKDQEHDGAPSCMKLLKLAQCKRCEREKHCNRVSIEQPILVQDGVWADDEDKCAEKCREP